MSDERTLTFSEQVASVNEMLDPGFEYEDYEDRSVDDEFRACIKFIEIDSENAKKYIACGSVGFEDTPSSLYRLLWLCQPKEAIDFSDMYKQALFSFTSSDERFVVQAYLYKYELGLYFYALRELVDTSEASGIIGGWPGADNGLRCTDPDGQAFFKMIEAALNTIFLVYGGNNFEV